jgi:hypothetical protein
MRTVRSGASVVPNVEDGAIAEEVEAAGLAWVLMVAISLRPYSSTSRRRADCLSDALLLFVRFQVYNDFRTKPVGMRT